MTQAKHPDKPGNHDAKRGHRSPSTQSLHPDGKVIFVKILVPKKVGTLKKRALCGVCIKEM